MFDAVLSAVSQFLTFGFSKPRSHLDGIDGHFRVIEDLRARGWRDWTDWVVTGDPRDGPMAHNWVWAYRPGWAYPVRMGGRSSNPAQSAMNVNGLYWKPAKDEETPETVLSLPIYPTGDD